MLVDEFEKLYGDIAAERTHLYQISAAILFCHQHRILHCFVVQVTLFLSLITHI